MKNFDLIMVTTHQDELNIFKLISSIDNNIENINVLLIVLSQECIIVYIPVNPLLSIVFIEDSKMGLSKARNIAMHYLLNNSFSAEYIMFPDDDSSYDENFFFKFPDIQNLNRCFVTSIYNEGTKDIYIGKKTTSDVLLGISDLRLIGSPNQIILYDKLKHQIFFNEQLGVGALYGSSEDMDLFIRLFNQGEQFVYTNKIYSYHPKKVAAYKNTKFKNIVERFRNYSSGFAYLIFKYRLYYFIPEYLIRTLLAFFVFFLKFQFKLAFAYLFQFFIRIGILIKFSFNKCLYQNN